MAVTNKTEVWLRGPLPGIIPALQPVAHALLQAREELNDCMKDFPDALLWQQPAGMAAVGFHVQHMTGVADRLFTYAQGRQLTGTQLRQLAAEGHSTWQQETAPQLVQLFNEQVDKAIIQLSNTTQNELFETRGVGRAQIPSTVLGLMVHAAEHTMRHLGQLLVTVGVLNAKAIF